MLQHFMEQHLEHPVLMIQPCMQLLTLAFRLPFQPTLLEAHLLQLLLLLLLQNTQEGHMHYHTVLVENRVFISQVCKDHRIRKYVDWGLNDAVLSVSYYWLIIGGLVSKAFSIRDFRGGILYVWTHVLFHYF